MKKCCQLIAILMFVSLLTACGQSGRLYLPYDETPSRHIGQGV